MIDLIEIYRIIIKHREKSGQVGLVVDTMGKRSYIVGYIIIVENFCLSETCRPTLNCILFDRFD